MVLDLCSTLDPCLVTGKRKSKLCSQKCQSEWQIFSLTNQRVQNIQTLCPIPPSNRSHQSKDICCSCIGPGRLKRAMLLVYAADQALRDTRPDDKTVMEDFVWKVTSKEG